MGLWPVGLQKVLVGAGECLVVTANPGWIRDQLTSSSHKYLLVDFANVPSTDTLNNYASEANRWCYSAEGQVQSLMVVSSLKVRILGETLQSQGRSLLRDCHGVLVMCLGLLSK